MKKLVWTLCLLLAFLLLAGCAAAPAETRGETGEAAGTGGTESTAEAEETGKVDLNGSVSLSGMEPIEIVGVLPGEDTYEEKGVQFYGTVMEYGAGYLLVAPDDGRVRLTAGPGGEFDEVPLFRVHVGEEFDISKYKTGDRIAVTYSGDKIETDPPQIYAMDIFHLDEAIAEGTDGDPAGHAPARCVMLDDRLFFDTNTAPDPGPTCGTMDGYLTEIPADEMPDENGEANFPASNEHQHAWQLWSENEVIILVNGEWHIFAAETTEPSPD